MNDDLYKLLIQDGVLFDPPSYTKQNHTIRGKTWLVPRLIEFSKLLEVKTIPLQEVGAVKFNRPLVRGRQLTLLELCYHLRLALEASTEWPIILGEDGRIMDGHHRVVKLLYEDAETIRVTQFEKDPPHDEERPTSTMLHNTSKQVEYKDFYDQGAYKNYTSRIDNSSLSDAVLISDIEEVKVNIAITNSMDTTHSDLANYLKVIMELEDEPVVCRDNHNSSSLVCGIPQIVKSIVMGNTYLRKIKI